MKNTKILLIDISCEILNWLKLILQGGPLEDIRCCWLFHFLYMRHQFLWIHRVTWSLYVQYCDLWTLTVMWSWERSTLQTRSRKPRIYIVTFPWERGVIWQVSKTILAWDACRNCCRQHSCSHRDPQCPTSALGSPHKAVLPPSTYQAALQI